MRIKLFATVFFTACLLVACGSSEPGGHAAAPSAASSPASSPVLSSLPATVEGDLEINVAEGDVEEGGASEFNFGTLTVNGNEISVQVSGSLLQSANLPNDSGRVRATLGSKDAQFGGDFYTITALKKL